MRTSKSIADTNRSEQDRSQIGDGTHTTPPLLVAYRREQARQRALDHTDRLLAANGPQLHRIQHVTSWDEFDALPIETQAAIWQQHALEQQRLTDGIAHHQGVINLPHQRPAPPKRAWTPRPVDTGAQLDDIPTDEYVWALTGEDVPIGRMTHCPLPDHDDGSPSFKAYDNQSWVCYGCNRGGRIFDFAAALWEHPMPLRGDMFREIRARLLTELGLR